MTLRGIRLWGKHIPDDKRAAIVAKVLTVLEGLDNDQALQAARIVVQMETNDLQAVQVLDKIARLDSGEDTERVGGTRTVRVVVEEYREQPRMEAMNAPQPAPDATEAEG